jgi:hypothetical protein
MSTVGDGQRKRTRPMATMSLVAACHMRSLGPLLLLLLSLPSLPRDCLPPGHGADCCCESVADCVNPVPSTAGDVAAATPAAAAGVLLLLTGAGCCCCCGCLSQTAGLPCSSKHGLSGSSSTLVNSTTCFPAVASDTAAYLYCFTAGTAVSASAAVTGRRRRK